MDVKPGPMIAVDPWLYMGMSQEQWDLWYTDRQLFDFLREQKRPRLQRPNDCAQWKKLNKGLQKIAAVQALGCVAPGGQELCVSGILTGAFDALVVDP